MARRGLVSGRIEDGAFGAGTRRVHVAMLTPDGTRIISLQQMWFPHEADYRSHYTNKVFHGLGEALGKIEKAGH